MIIVHVRRVLILVIALSGCDHVFGLRAPPDVDAAPVLDAPFDLDTPWGLPSGQTVLPIGAGDDPTLTGDQLELVYEDNQGTLWSARREALTQPWTLPTVIAELADSDFKTTPELTPDGLTLGYSTNAGPLGGNDLAIAHRVDRSAPWVFDRYLTELNSPSFDTSPSMDAAGTTIVFSSNRDGSMDLWIATRPDVNASWSAPSKIAALSTPVRDSVPHLSADGLAVHFVRDVGSRNDLFVSRRTSTSAEFPVAQPISELNTLRNESDPWVSPDHRHIYYITNDDTPQSILMYATR